MAISVACPPSHSADRRRSGPALSRCEARGQGCVIAYCTLPFRRVRVALMERIGDAERRATSIGQKDCLTPFHEYSRFVGDTGTTAAGRDAGVIEHIDQRPL